LFEIVNSHGVTWGKKGFGTMTYGYLINSFIDGFAPLNGDSLSAVGSGFVLPKKTPNRSAPKKKASGKRKRKRT